MSERPVIFLPTDARLDTLMIMASELGATINSSANGKQIWLITANNYRIDIRLDHPVVRS